MKVKVFQPNPNGKIEFTRAELEKLLNEVYSDGYREGEYSAKSQNWTWTSPSLTMPYCDTSATNVIDNLKCLNKTAETSEPQVYSIDITSKDFPNLSKAVNEIIAKAENASRASNRPLTVFDTLAKELNF